ncbi:hypothetical protein [Marinimicrobium locisalis]|uniref:hypothetical protein n=1 Tax=Marinimicrobium locisalis TaxID=546022 RepID=UPI0032220AA7
MDKRLQRRLAAFRPNREQTVRLVHGNVEPLEFSYSTDERLEPRHRLLPTQVELKADDLDGPLHRVRSLSWDFRALFGRTGLLVDLEVTLMRYPSFRTLAEDPERLLQMAEYHDFLHQVVDVRACHSWRGAGLGFTTLGDRPWLRFFHLTANLSVDCSPAVDPVAHRDPRQVDWTHPVKTDIDMHWLTPIANDCALAIRVSTRLGMPCRYQQIDAVSPGTLRNLGDAVASTLVTRPAVNLSSHAERAKRNGGLAGNERSFQWPPEKPRSAALTLQGLWDMEDWAPLFKPTPWFNITEPGGSMVSVSPEQVLDTAWPEVRDDLDHQSKVARQWQSTLDQLGVEEKHFLGDTEHLIVRGC